MALGAHSAGHCRECAHLEAVRRGGGWGAWEGGVHGKVQGAFREGIRRVSPRASIQGRVYCGDDLARERPRGWFTICGGPIHGRYATPHLTHIFRMNRLNQGSTDKARGAAHFKTEEGSDIVYECARIFFPKLIKLHKHYGLENGTAFSLFV